MTTNIGWTDETWNPVTGCSKVSAGCDNCYAERLSLKFGWSKKPWTPENAAENVVLQPERLRKPYSWKEPKRVFVNSMSDLFHVEVPDDFIRRVYSAMEENHRHIYQILTKRPGRMARFIAQEWGTTGGYQPQFIWHGTSVEDSRVVGRIDALRRVNSAVRFLSLEPLIGDLGKLDLTGIHWVIVGGESGPNFRPMKPDWARSIRDQCVKAGVAFFYKQGSAFRSESNPYLDGEEWHEYPQVEALV
jgi:protein gp37